MRSDFWRFSPQRMLMSTNKLSEILRRWSEKAKLPVNGKNLLTQLWGHYDDQPNEQESLPPALHSFLGGGEHRRTDSKSLWLEYRGSIDGNQWQRRGQVKRLEPEPPPPLTARKLSLSTAPRNEDVIHFISGREWEFIPWLPSVRFERMRENW